MRAQTRGQKKRLSGRKEASEQPPRRPRDDHASSSHSAAVGFVKEVKMGSTTWACVGLTGLFDGCGPRFLLAVKTQGSPCMEHHAQAATPLHFRLSRLHVSHATSTRWRESMGSAVDHSVDLSAAIEVYPISDAVRCSRADKRSRFIPLAASPSPERLVDPSCQIHPWTGLGRRCHCCAAN